MNSRELECLFRASEYFSEMIEVSKKAQVTENYISHALNSYMIDNGHKLDEPESFDQVVRRIHFNFKF